MASGFSQRVNRVMVLANDIARRHGASEIDDLSVLIAIVEENRGIAATVLQQLGVELPQLYRNVAKPASASASPQWLASTEQLRRIIESAGVIASESGADSVGTEHLLLAMLRNPDCVASRALLHWSVTEDAVRKTAAQLV